MKELFNNIISVQLGASIAIVLLLLSRRIMKKRYVAKLRYWLWLIIAIRLCIPVDINIQLNRTAPVNVPVQDYYVATQQSWVTGETTRFEIITADQLQLHAQQFEQQQNPIEPQSYKTVSLTDLAYKVWLIVAALLLSASFISYFMAKNDIMATAVYDDALTGVMENYRKQMGINRRVKIAVCRYTGSPMLTGLLNPVIVLPDIGYTDTQLEMILRHELTHLRRNDILYKLILHIVSCVYWFNPLTACMARLAGKDIEMSCDEEIVKNKDNDFKAEYAQTIIRAISLKSNRLVLATTFSHNANTVKERFSTIFFSRKLKKGQSLVAVFMAVVVAATSLVGCTKAYSANGGKFSQDENTFTDKAGLSGGSFADSLQKTVYIGDVDTEKSRIVFNYDDDGYEGITDNSQQFDTNTFYFRLNKDNGSKYGLNFTGTLDEYGQQVVLCSKSGCYHSDTTCPGYINMTGNYFTVNGKLYFYSPFAYSYGDDPYDGTGDRIRLLSVTEKGKSLFCEIAGYTGTDGGIVITDGKCLYFIADKRSDNRVYLMKIDLETATYSEICAMPVTGGYSVFKLSDITADGKQIIFSVNAGYNRYTSKIGVINLEDSSIDFVKELKDADFKTANGSALVADYTIYGNHIYKVNAATGRITRQRLGETEVETLVENVKSVIGQTDYISIDYTYNDKMVLTKHIDDGSKYGTTKNYVFDMNTSEITPLNITGRDSRWLISLVRVYFVTPDYFLIATNNSDFNAYVNEMAIISKTDFYNNKPRIVPVGMMRVG